MKAACAVLMLVVILLASSTAAADVVAWRDGDDTVGRLDIASVRHGHRGARSLIHTIRTRETWRKRVLRDESSWLALVFDRRKATSRDDRYLRIDFSKDSGLYARLTTFGTHGPGELIARVPVWRPTRRSVRVRFRKGRLGRDLKRYEWRAITSFENAGKCRSGADSADQGGCIDYSPRPRRRGVVHELVR